MSLRTEIREAVDEVTPPAPGLSAAVDAFVIANARQRVAPKPRRAHGWTTFFRGSLAMAAMVLLIAMVAAVLAGGRLVQDWNALHHSVTAGPSARDLQVAQLEARPLNLPAMPADGMCPDGPVTNGDYYGSGPAYAEFGLHAASRTAWGTYGGGALVVDNTVKGLILIRGRDLKTGQPVEFVDRYGYGPAEGTDVVDRTHLQRHPEDVLDMDHPPSVVTTVGKSTWSLSFGFASGFSGCTGWEVDGPGFSEVFVTGLLAV